MGGRSFTAVSLRLALSFSLVAISLLTSIALYFIYGGLQSVATDVSHVVVDSSVSQTNIQTLQKVQQELADEKDVIARAGDIVADSKSYQYQNQILNDLNNYAGKAGISITNVNFDAAGDTGTTPPAKGAPTAPAGLKSTSVSITLQNPVPYDSMLRFIRSIEQNLTKMQISRVALAKGTSGNTVTSEALTIQVYIK